MKLIWFSAKCGTDGRHNWQQVSVPFQSCRPTCCCTCLQVQLRMVKISHYRKKLLAFWLTTFVCRDMSCLLLSAVEVDDLNITLTDKLYLSLSPIYYFRIIFDYCKGIWIKDFVMKRITLIWQFDIHGTLHGIAI